jgi:hypothetical protein
MTLPKKTQDEINELYNSVARYFASSGVSEDYYKNPNKENIIELQQILDDERNEKTKNRTTLTETFIDDLNQQIKYKTSEVEMLKDQLLLLDLKIDGYDVIINNIDKEIIPLIDEINVAITSVKTAYDTRVSAGCSSDLYWELTVSQVYTTFFSGGFGLYPIEIYTCKKNPNAREDYNYYGAKYYRKPQNQDYGANIINEFLGTISVGSTSLAIVGSGSTFNLQIGDNVIDNIDNPIVFSAGNLPKIVSFGVTSIVGTSTNFGGSISSGSTIIAHVGIGTTVGINTGDSVSLFEVTALNTTVVGFGTTTITLTDVWDPDANGPGSGAFISTTGITNSLIISVPSIGSTADGNFSIGLKEEYPSIILDNVSLQEAVNSRFTVFRDTQTESTVFDYTNNPIDPVTVGIMGNNSIALGHKLVLVNNGSPIGPFQWHEVRGEFAPEPPCGASFARYYPGNLSWPTKETFTYGIGGFPPTSTSPAYAQEGDTVTVGFGLTIPFGIGTTSKSENNPTFSGCGALQTAINNAETSRDVIITRNTPKINNLINSGSALRRLRDKFESQAFAILQGRVFANVEINNLKQDLAALQSVDISQFEPESYYFDKTGGKTSSSTIGT